MLPQYIQIFNYTVKNQADSTVDIYVDGDIVDASTQEIMRNWWGDETSVSYKSFRNQIESLSPKTVNVWINSTGGHVGDAMAMHDYLADLENKNVTVNRHGRGIIASAATYLLIGKNSEMSENSFLMIHNIQMVAVGDINQVENQARAGRKFNDRIRDFYSNETGNAPETISKWMNSETWMTAQEAKDKGFIKNITGQATFKNSISTEKFPYTNTQVLNVYNSYTKSNYSNMESKLLDAITNGFKDLCDKLGLKNKSDEKEVKDAFEQFTNSISAAIGENKSAGLTEEAVNKLISDAFSNIAKNEHFTNALTEAIKDMPSKTDVTESLKNVVTKDDLKNSLDDFKSTITNAISEKLGNKTDSRNTGKAVVKNIKKGKFSNAAGWEVED